MSVDWTAIRTDYENGLSLRQLAAKYSVSKSVIGERKYKEQWDAPDKRTPLSNQNIPNRDVNAGVRAALAMKLRAGKMTYDAIAKQCGYGSASACRKAIQRELQRVVVASAEDLRHEELSMLDQLQMECWAMAMDRENTYRTFAMDRLLAISKRRSELMGLDARPDDALAGVTIIREYGVEVDKV